MADGRDLNCWDNHALEQVQTNPYPHKISEDSVWRQWLLTRKAEISNVLDLGCGGGLWRDLFDGFNYVGADQSAGMIREAKNRGCLESQQFIQVPWNKLPFREGSFDLVWTAAVLQHNLHDQKAEVVQEIVRVLRPGGHFMCTENTFRDDNFKTTFRTVSSWNDQLDDGYSFTKGGWERFMKRHGLNLVDFKTPSEYLFTKE